MITRQDAAARFTDYLNHHLSLEELVQWAEDAMIIPPSPSPSSPPP